MIFKSIEITAETKLQKKQPYIKKIIDDKNSVYKWNGEFVKSKMEKNKMVFDITEEGVYQLNCIEGVSDRFEKVFAYINPQSIYVEDEEEGEIEGFGEVVLSVNVMPIIEEIKKGTGVNIFDLKGYK